MSAQHYAAAWDHLPLGVQQRILVLTGHPSARRVSKAWRAAYDATNDTLSVRLVLDTEQSLKPAAAAAVTRVIKNSAGLTAVNFMDCHDNPPAYPTNLFMLPVYSSLLPLTLSDLLAAGAASSLATRLRKLTGVQIDPESAVQQLQALQQCTGLTHLDISGSDPEDWLPEQGHQAAAELTAALQGMRRLVRLHVCELLFEGSVVTLASALQPLTQLQHVHFRCSGLGEAGVAALAPALSAMPGLQTLDFSNNSLEGPEGAEALCGLLGAVPGLTHLNVSGNNFVEEAADLLALVPRGMMCLQTLILSEIRFTNQGMVTLASALEDLPHLHTLHLSGDVRVAHLRPVSGGRDNPTIGRIGFRLEGVRALAERLSAATQLRELRLEFMRLGDEGWVALAPALGCLAPSLRSLQLSIDRVDAAGVAALAASLEQLTGLTCLEARRIFGSAAMVTISPALMGIRRLQSLDLGNSVMGAEGTVAFAAALPAFAGSLTHLTLSNCSRHVEAAANALAPALAQATSLIELHLDDIYYKQRGAQWLLPVLSALPHLRKVDLGKCALRSQTCLAVAQAVRERDGIMLVLRDDTCYDNIAEGDAVRTELLSIPGVNVHLH